MTVTSYENLVNYSLRFFITSAKSGIITDISSHFQKMFIGITSGIFELQSANIGSLLFIPSVGETIVVNGDLPLCDLVTEECQIDKKRFFINPRHVDIEFTIDKISYYIESRGVNKASREIRFFLKCTKIGNIEVKDGNSLDTL